MATAIITPRSRCCRAVEGLERGHARRSQPFVVPITIVILLGLFLFQKAAPARVGAVFGPVMLIWFLVDLGRSG